MSIDDLDFPDSPSLIDPIVNVHLMTGRIIQLQEVSIVEIAKRLHQYGFLFLSDGNGEYAVFFKHGVACLVAGSDRSSSEVE